MIDWIAIFSNAAQELISPTTAAYALAALGLAIHFGYTGLLNFGQAGFMALGAYGYAISTLSFGFPVWASVLVGVGASVIFALILGIPTLRLRADDDSVYVAIADTGSGIKAEDLAKLFQPYHTTKVSGHGLGLMIVQRIVRDHGGHVAMESKEGVGTVVTLQFPQKHRRVRMLAGG